MAGGGYIDPYGFSKSYKAPSSSGSSPSSKSSYNDPYGFAAHPAGRGPAGTGGHGGGVKGGFGWLGSKLGLAAHDIAAMPTGLYETGKAISHDTAKALKSSVGVHSGYGSGKYETPGLARSMVKSTVESVKHPLRDPFQTLLTVGALAAPVARLGAAGAAAKAADEAGVAGRAAAAGKALLKKPLMPTRALHVPTLVKDESKGLPSEAHLLDNPRDRFVPIRYHDGHITVGEPGGSHTDFPKGEGVQGYAVVEHGKVVRTNFTHPSAGKSEVPLPELGKFMDQYDRNHEIQSAVKSAVESKFPGSLRVEHEPVHLVEAHAPLIRAAQALHDKILQRSLDANLTAEKPSIVAEHANSRVGKALDEEGRIGRNTRNVSAHILGRVKGFDKGVETGHGQLALFLRSANVMPDEARDFWREQAAAGVSPKDTTRLANWADQIHQNGLMMTGPDGRAAIDNLHYPKLADVDQLVKHHQELRENFIHDEHLMSPEGQQARKALVAETMKSESARNPATGVREGQGYTDLSISKKNPPRSAFARGRSPVIPQPKKLSLGKEATGEGVAKGLIPESTTKAVANSSEEVLRQIATRERRASVYRYGSDVKRQGDDILIANPHHLKLGKIPLDTRQLLGLEHSTLHMEPASEEAGIAAALRARAEDAIPRLISKKAKDFERAAEIGTEAPDGYRWVPRKIAGDLLHETEARNGAVKRVNDVNSAITAATVYFKLSHIPQRLATDATTSLLNGALKPSNLAAAAKLRKALSEQEFNELSASTGTHGYQALPAEGTSKVARAAQGGASFYAHRIDAPFRFMNLVHEASKAGMDTPEGMRALLKAAKDPASATPRQLSVLKRSNRVSMIYDGLGPGEQRVIARYLWFYPWTKAAFRFAGHTIAEHPLASAAGGALGKQGEQAQAKGLGALPYYEEGLTPLGGNEVTNFANLSPYTTAGNVLDMPVHPESIRGNLNPAAAALVDALTGTNSFGAKENRGKAALADLTAPTPEGQILTGFLGRHSDQSSKMFPNSGAWEGMRAPLLRALIGQSVPRKVNKEALKRATEQWKTISFPVGG